MADSYPYMVSNNRIGPIFEKIRSAAKPPKFSNEFLKQLGFTSSNDRAIIPLLRKLGFISEDGSPTVHYDRLKDATQYKYAIGERVKELYKDLFTINESINGASDEEIKGAISRVTGKDEKLVNFYFTTFKTLTNLGKFDSAPIKKEEKTKDLEPKVDEPEHDKRKLKADFHYNIQIHLPATTDISVYNAIFKSLKDNLLV